jgi:molybdenum cofactor cytidylyltransferase
MKFLRLPVHEALGGVLAHTTRLPGGTLPKGTILTADAIAKLTAAQHTHATVAILDPGDIAENEAARRLADALTSPGLIRTRPATGRANLTAAHPGLFRANAADVDALNSLHEGLTLATLPDTTPVRPGDLVATVKIIPFAIPATALQAAEAVARTSAPLSLPAFRPLRVGLVLTELPGLKQSVLRGTIEATQKRVRDLTGSLLPPLRVPHAAPPLATALQQLASQGAELLLIAPASATVDRGDIAPAAIQRAGGTISHFGMPVDPGNLICIGQLGMVPTVVLPGCARSPARNGIDLVLARLFAGAPAGPREIARMGVGGLLKETATRPAPRLRAAPPRRIAAVVLAAGLSTRAAPRNKLLQPDAAGTPMIARTVDAVLASRARPVCVVTGHQSAEIMHALAGRDVVFVPAADYATGMAASLRAGITALPPEIDAALIVLGDMPLVTAAEINRLLDAYDPQAGRLVVVPMHAGQRGNPVLWDRTFFPRMAQLAGDTGARALLRENPACVTEVAFDSEFVLCDFDTVP